MRRIIAAAAAVITLALALAVPAAAGTSASAPARPAPVARLHCGAAHRATGHLSLAGLSKRTSVPIAILLDFAFRCSPDKAGGWTGAMAAYLSRGDLRAPMPKGLRYWIMALP